MKKLALLTAGLFFALAACNKDDEDDEPSAYQGNWEFKSQQGSFDTTFTANIDAEGKFDYTFQVGQFQAKINADVNENGGVSGDIGSNGLTVGQMTGKLNTSGNGNGNYIILNDTIAWEATKQ